MTVRIIANEKASPNGKLADAELVFTDGELTGMKLMGFAVWQRRNGPGRNVTFPSRSYTVNGQSRVFTLLRPIDDSTNEASARDLILAAYAALESHSND